jgi:DNA-binding CsgD family transcriptional regulator
MASEVIGREDEIEQLRAFLDGNAVGPRALVLEGEAGIGKSTIWLAGLELAQERGLRVLSSRPAEAEQDLAFAGLGDLIEGLMDDVLPALPPPRRHALEVALLVEEAHEPLDPRALGVAVRSALELLAAEQPLVLAVDDVQWLDGSSVDALAFALRRTSAPLTILLARRLSKQSEASPLEHALAAASLERLRVGPLSTGALQAVLRERLDRVFPRPTLLRIHETSGGNPFYALELTRALPVDLDPTEPLPIPESLDELVGARLTALPEGTRNALALVAALGVAPVDLLGAAGHAEDALEPALAAHVVERVVGGIRFTHPLLASALYRGLADGERRAAHRLLGQLLHDPIAAARHLALAADGPDAEIADALDEAATEASVRGTAVVAAELGELARRLTPGEDGEGRRRRGILAATALLRAGDVGRARTLADEILAEAPTGRPRAEALVLLSSVEGRSARPKRAIALRRDALREAGDDLALRAAVHQWLAANVADATVRDRERHALESLELAEKLGDDALRAGALAVLAVLHYEAGEPDAVALAEEAHALAVALVASPRTSRFEVAHLLAWSYDRLDLLASFTLAGILMAVGRRARAGRLMDDLERELAPRDELLESKVRWMRASLETQAARWDLAAEHLLRVQEVMAQYEAAWPSPVIQLADLAVHRGEVGHARELLAGCRELAERQPDALAALEAVLGIAARVSGDLEASIAQFAAAEKIGEAIELREPTTLWWRADFVEVLLESGRVDEAVELLDAWEADARRLGRDRVVADATRCRGLLAAARGDLDLGCSTLEDAVRQHEQVGDPFGRARSLLALGVARRRGRQKSAAREAIEAALLGFEDLGEVFWTARARAELGRIGGRTREEGLTPAEQRVAALVAEGRTNREVAAALVLGERTVETHLTHIYAKLGIRSRTELARVYEPVS